MIPTTDILLFEQRDAVAYLTLNRPDSLNALSPALVADWNKAAKAIAQSPDIKVLVVQGAGRAWSAGVDLQALNESIQGGQFAADQILKDGLQLIETLQAMPQVTIAAINGFCFTGALEIALAFDLIVAADEARIGDTHAKWGIAPKWGMTQRLPQRIGLLKAMEMSFTTQPISGTEAAALGLANRSVPLAQLDQTVAQLAAQITQNSAQTIAAMKQLYYYGAHHTLHEGLEHEYQADIRINDREEFLRDFKQNKKR
ncbi:enoyl-CoA hydratase/isomerase family protein [Eisenibacter elegans]|jgi:enoyl-CoA hydratase/carnithine racemase|uniref:enoyl-CoA hydratase/isomerase family protein n=1 Tax=Eisenibacter elegans TaxID=997 RepID=UPI000421FB8D|nr:enoyl-CoA hydratase/isomerase family protein [Eisenibacter elegans]